MAKGILVQDEHGYLLMVPPSDYHIELETLRILLRQQAELATESEAGSLFNDCDPGAVPPIGEACGIKTIWDPTTSLGQGIAQTGSNPGL